MKRQKPISVSVLLFLLLILGLAFSLVKNSQQKPTQITQEVKSSDEKEDVETPLMHVSTEISPNGVYILDAFSGDYADRYNYYQLFVTELATREARKVYSGDFRTSDWRWTDDNKIKIFYNCGTGCEASKILGVNDSVSFEDYKDGGVSKENGWVIEFFE